MFKYDMNVSLILHYRLIGSQNLYLTVTFFNQTYINTSLDLGLSYISVSTTKISQECYVTLAPMRAIKLVCPDWHPILELKCITKH